ncbi:MAG: hypothetical protein HY647_04780 [Acidobacteria bacterium]|nr:hypothetical protein [Acidobacteriota bacterium]
MTNSTLSVLLIFGLLAISCNRQQAIGEDVPPTKEGTVARSTESHPVQPTAKPSPAPESTPSPGEHRDHDPKHGGTFFMALDDKHHLEGVLLPPAAFRVYLYDAYSRPLPPQELKEAEGKVLWGDSLDAPPIPLRLAADLQCLEAVLDTPARFPVTLTLVLKLPGSSPEARPELFTFPFSHYSEHHAEDPGHSH